MLSILSSVALAFALAAPPSQDAPVGQGGAIVEDSRSEAAGTTSDTVAAQERPGVLSGLPRRAPEPRTMAAYWPVFLVLSVTWIGFVGYMLLLGRRSSRLARSISDTGAER